MRLWANGIGWLTVAILLLSGAVQGEPGKQGSSKAASISTAGSDISGFWDLSFDSRKVPPAHLAAGVTQAMIDAKKKKDEHAIRWCNLLGTPFIMDPSRPLDIRQGKAEVIISAETYATPRHLYFRSAHINPEIWDPSTNGDSVAHWEGDTLIVDTVGFSEDKGLSAIPGGGFRTARSHLVERYHLIENGSVLSVTSTWEDPKVFRTPHTYEFRYYRLPLQYEPAEMDPCNPYDEVRTKFLEQPIAAKPVTAAH